MRRLDHVLLCQDRMALTTSTAIQDENQPSPDRQCITETENRGRLHQDWSMAVPGLHLLIKQHHTALRPFWSFNLSLQSSRQWWCWNDNAMPSGLESVISRELLWGKISRTEQWEQLQKETNYSCHFKYAYCVSGEKDYEISYFVESGKVLLGCLSSFNTN